MILTKDYLRKLSERRNFSVYKFVQQQVITDNNLIFKSKNAYDLFISHSFLDKDLVYSLVDIFNRSGYSVYVDWMIDSQLDRSLINKNTSQTLKMRMDSSKGLAYIATSNSSQSKWCPWELGYEDGKTKGRCAILPVLNITANTFKGQEYLGMYPYIEYMQIPNTAEYDFWVCNNEKIDSYISLSSWLKGNDPI